ncbi:MAG: hypothetical protein HQK98_01085 [Nitrospirae bacterium]|nr:hypothetical protein [Nitrospirota bacterium]
MGTLKQLCSLMASERTCNELFGEEPDSDWDQVYCNVNCVNAGMADICWKDTDGHLELLDDLFIDVPQQPFVSINRYSCSNFKSRFKNRKSLLDNNLFQDDDL